MRVRIWNAFASNNSGSYVIVGRFPTVELAQQVADELLVVMKAESAWRLSPGDGPSPVAAYAARHGIRDASENGDDWPEYSSMPHPAAWAIGHQVFVHSDQTVSMPRAIGHAMYARGGRVETELDHAHHAIAALFEIYFPWTVRKTIDIPARVQDIVDALCAEGGPLHSLEMTEHAPGWRGAVPGAPEAFGEPDIVIGAAFDDLCAGFTAIASACAAVGAVVRVVISESPAHADPFAFLRPSVPQPRNRVTS
jgi:hypothetical protein